MGSFTSSLTDSSPTQPDKPPAFTKHSLNVMEVLVSMTRQLDRRK